MRVRAAYPGREWRSGRARADSVRPTATTADAHADDHEHACHWHHADDNARPLANQHRHADEYADRYRYRNGNCYTNSDGNTHAKPNADPKGWRVRSIVPRFLHLTATTGSELP
jgi:hypothetical protein